MTQDFHVGSKRSTSWALVAKVLLMTSLRSITSSHRRGLHSRSVPPQLPAAERPSESKSWSSVAAVLLLIALPSITARLRRGGKQAPPAPSPSPTPKRSAVSKSWLFVAAFLLLAGAAAISVGVRGGDHALPAPSPSPTAKRFAAPADKTPPAVATLATVRSVPTNLSIPAIGLSVSLSTLGTNADGTVQVPTNDQQPGWFRLGPSPGQVGSAVILGHVDNYTGPGVFFQLRTLVAGDQVFVTLSDGDTAQFAVSSVAMYSKQQFPDQSVYASHGSSALQLVTCGGVFDHQTGSYLSNIVVYSSLVAVTPSVA
jgi:sortase (surface protein transpeptidase)